MFVYHVYKSRYQKYNRLYKLEHHKNIVWYCKANFKINLLRPETKKGELYTHSFKYTNCNARVAKSGLDLFSSFELSIMI